MSDGRRSGGRGRPDRRGRTVLLIATGVLAARVASAQQADSGRAEPRIRSAAPSVQIPRVPSPPTLAALLDPSRVPAALQGFRRVSGFVQRTPVDGRPADFPTDAYVGFDKDALHIVFLAFDPRADRIRGRMVPRENIGGDDLVTLMLDTDADQRRAYVFRANPRGVQWDALYTEGQGFDISFDAVWESEGRVFEWGYAVRMAIPFVSLRFEPADTHVWRLVLERQVARGTNEDSYWPRVSSEVEGILTQSAELRGLAGISPGRNLQLIPYSTFRSFRALDPGAPGGPAFVSDPAEVAAGADFKAILDDRFVLDVTANPDFSQVESDQPQVTVNQRFEVFFPERRPFFTENADYFRTPITLLFSRRVRDPFAGVRFTGKAKGWGVGALVIDDEAPGRLASPASDSAGSRAWFTVGRLTRDVGEHSVIGAMYAGREHRGAYNRTGGLDARLRLHPRWTVSGQVAASASGGDGRRERSGLAYTVSASRSGQHLSVFTSFADIEEDFEARPGFVPRTDIRRLSHFSSYFFRPETGILRSWGFELFAQSVWDHEGANLDRIVEPSVEWNFLSNSNLEFNYRNARERLRPEDHGSLERSRTYDVDNWDIEFGSGLLPWLNVSGNFGFGRRINLRPAGGGEPETGDWRRLLASVGVRPGSRLRVDNDVIWSRLADRATGDRIFSDWILRTRWNWQWTRELSIRAILQYEDRATEGSLTALEARRNLNADLLITYRVNPWTAVFAGLNGNAQNLEIVDLPDGQALERTDRLRQDARQAFVKLTYLLRF